MNEKRQKTGEGNSLVSIIANLIVSLNEKEKRVLNGRFGFSGKKETLSAIGRELKLSRERVRQIEKNSLNKISKTFNDKYKNKAAEVESKMKQNGGVLSDDQIPESMLELAGSHKFAKNYLFLICTITKNISKVDESTDLKSGWRLDDFSKDEIIDICNKVITYLKEEEIPLNIKDLKDNIPGISKYEEKTLSACVSISNKLMMAKNELVGLRAWPSVNPRNVRDKIYYVLKTAGEPLHFTEITSKIADLKFDKKRVVRATVHNELIADSRFVLIGRGIYALREWGYNDGTVYEVIKNILSNSKSPLAVSEIIELVNRSRKVKRNTIIINLQTKDEFKKTSGGYVFQGLSK